MDSPPAWIRPYIGLPYKQYDCWQLCKHVLEKECGTTVSDFHKDLVRLDDLTLWDNDTRQAVFKVVKREMKNPIWKEVDYPELYDIVLYAIGNTRWHTAIFAGDGWVLMTEAKLNCHAVQLRDSRWTGRLKGYWRYVG